MTVILAKATGADNSSDIKMGKRPVTVSIYPEANFAAETGDLAKKNEDGTYDDQYLTDGTQIRLSATLPSFTITGGGIYRIEFAARTSAIGVKTDDGTSGY